MSHQTIKVNLDSGSYPVYIGRGLLKAKSLLTRHIRGHQVMIVTQKSIAKYYLKHLLESLNAYQCDVIYIAPGEKNKSIASWNIILNGLINKKHERTTTIIALGGGIVGDVAGFAAACYLRGVSLIQIPTTLIAQVDSSVGGKTGVNHRYGKNLIGAFYQPQCVLIDTLTLNTLPEREYVSGLAEIIKYGLIQNKRFFSWLEKNATALLVRDQAALQKAIQYSVKAKAAIVAQDEYEQNGIRSLLNFGHTAGHALEKISDYQLLHGEAVAIGINIAAQLSALIKSFSEQDCQRVKHLIAKTQLPLKPRAKINIKKFLSYLKRDKKKQRDVLRFVLLNEIGEAELVSGIKEADIIKIISRL